MSDKIKIYILNRNIFLLLILIGSPYIFNSCSGCSQSGIRYGQQGKNYSNNRTHSSSSERNRNTPERKTRYRSQGKTIIKMEKKNGVYSVPVELNGTKMYFIFDTGASIISISETEAAFLIKQGTLTKEDVIGKANFSNANGDITEGTIINLKIVKIGNVTLKNIKASVVPNANAPLLFGQSALEKFGKISIDYKRGEITLE